MTGRSVHIYFFYFWWSSSPAGLGWNLYFLSLFLQPSRWTTNSKKKWWTDSQGKITAFIRRVPDDCFLSNGGVRERTTARRWAGGPLVGPLVLSPASYKKMEVVGRTHGNLFMDNLLSRPCVNVGSRTLWVPRPGQEEIVNEIS